VVTHLKQQNNYRFVQHFEMSFAPYDRAMLDARFSLRQLNFLFTFNFVACWMQRAKNRNLHG